MVELRWIFTAASHFWFVSGSAANEAADRNRHETWRSPFSSAGLLHRNQPRAAGIRSTVRRMRDPNRWSTSHRIQYPLDNQLAHEPTCIAKRGVDCQRNAPRQGLCGARRPGGE